MPKRIQRRRTKGWRLPPNTVCVTRPGKWGNPYSLAVTFRWWLMTPQPQTDPPCDPARDRILADIEELRGKDLACWCGLCEKHRDGLPLGEHCPDCPACHADILLELANK